MVAKLSNQDRARAIGFIQSGRSIRFVARHFHISPTTVSNLVRRYNETGDVKDRHRSGRPRVTTPAEDRRICTLALRSRTKPATEITAEIRADRRRQRGLCSQTVRNRLRQQGLRSRKPSKEIFLTPQHKQNRLLWARQHRRWTLAQWSDVIFTDESRFCIFSNDGRRRVWRRRGERFAECCVQTVRQGHGGGLMVWGGISLRGKTDLVFVDGNMNARRYIDQVLQPVVVPYVHNRVQNLILMDDNARPHRAHVVAAFLQQQNIQRMDPWPAGSPDLNPIEHCWDKMGRAVRLRIQPGDTLVELRRYLQDAWNNVTPDYINRLIRSMRRRCEACIAARGAHTRY